MKTIVITGGTDGMGRRLAEEYLGRGDRVVAVARRPQAGQALAEKAAALGAADRFTFMQCDLSLAGNTIQLARDLRRDLPTIDALIFCARHLTTDQVITPEGFEQIFASFYVSRAILSLGLIEPLERAQAPIILNVAGPGQPGEIDWDDIDRSANYVGIAALGQAGRATELFGRTFVDDPRVARTKYVSVFPGVVATSFSGSYDAEWTERIAQLKKTAMPASDAIPPLLALVDTPPAGQLTAFSGGREIPLGASADPEAAHRLDRLMRGRLNAIGIDLRDI